MTKKKILNILSVACFACLLTSCDDDIINYPTNADQAIVTVNSDTNGDVTQNIYSEIYKEIESANNKSSKTLDNILYKLATEKYLVDDYAVSTDDFNKRVHDTMMTTARASTYTTDYEFDEYRYALSLLGSRYVIKTKDGKTNLADLKAAAFKGVVTPEMEYDDVFMLDYSDYVTRELKPTIYRQYLVGKYIYDQSYSSIGTTNARNATAVKITDRSDKPGEAKKLVDAFYKDFIANKAATAEEADLKNLTRLWKGVNITTAEKDWLAANKISTLADQIDEEVAKIYTDNEFTTNAELESKYTGSYSYPVSWGQTLAKRQLEQEKIYYEDTYLKSNGLTELPDTLKNRVFSTNYSTDVEAIESGSKKDNSFIITHNDGTEYRYTTAAISEAGSSSSNIITYNSADNSYYIVQLHSIVTTARIAPSDSDTEAVKAEKRKLAIDASYSMGSQDSYKKSAITWYLLNNDISYSDPDFYDYIDSNYPDVFED